MIMDMTLIEICFFINDLHWNKKGNIQVAKEIISKIDF